MCLFVCSGITHIHVQYKHEYYKNNNNNKILCNIAISTKSLRIKFIKVTEHVF